MKYLWIISILTFLFFSQSIASVGDYFEQITIFSDGRLTRFDKMPIRIYTDEIPVPDALKKQYMSVLNEVISNWEEVSDGKIQFSQISKKENADIRLSWSNKLPSYPRNPIGEAVLVRTKSFYVEIKIGLRDSTTASLLRPKTAKSILLHELGHAIGLWGHSHHPQDVMHYAATALYPSKRDINTLLKVYSTPNNKPFHEQAIVILKSEIKIQPKNPRYHYLLGSVYADQGRYQLAIEALNKAFELDPDFTGITTRLAMAFEKSGKYDEAIKYYTQILCSEPTKYIYGNLGTLYLLQGKYRKAIDFYQKGLKLYPNSSTLKHNILAVYNLWAIKLIRAEQYMEAIALIEKALQEYPDSDKLIYNKALAFESTEQYEQAIEYYKQILDRDPEHIQAKIGIASAYNNLGASKFESQNWDDAIKFCSEAIAYDTSCWQAKSNIENAHMNRAWKLLESNNFDDAIEEYKKVLEIDPENVRAHNNLGVAFFKKGDYDKAIAEFNEALRLDPQFEESTINLQRVKKRISIEIIKKVLYPLVIILSSFIIMKWTIRRVQKKTDEINETQDSERGMTGKNNRPNK